MYKISPQLGRVSISKILMLYTLLFAEWFQYKRATKVQYTAGNHSINMTAEYFECF